MKKFDGMYTISIEEAQSARAERGYAHVHWNHPIISLVIAAGVVAVFSFNGLVV